MASDCYCRRANLYLLGLPACPAALGDAADQLDLDLAVDIRSSHDVAAVEGQQKIAEADGLFLLGGSDMSQTEGQIQAAIFALDRRIPTLGLCFGNANHDRGLRSGSRWMHGQ